MKEHFLREVRPGVLAARPNPVQFGHLALEILMALAEARNRRAELYWLRPRRTVGDALFLLEPEGVRVLPEGPWHRLAMEAAWRRGAWPERYREARRQGLESLYHETVVELSRHIAGRALTEARRDRFRQARTSLRQRELALREQVGAAGPYFRRRLVLDPVPVRLRAASAAEAAAAAAALGIDPEAPIVTLHAREAGFKRGKEVQEKHRRLGKRRVRDDSVRNMNVESLLPAVDLLRRRGYTVVRIGDPSMRPVSHPGLVDLATSPRRTGLLDTYCLLRSTFLLSGEAGPVGAAYLTNTAILTVNVTDPISSYPVRGDGLHVLKRVVSRATGRELAPGEMLSADHLAHVRDTSRFHYEDNTPDEIVAAVEEMLELLGGGGETAAQADYRRAATEAADTLGEHLSYVRKWGTENGFLGRGRLARVSCEGTAA